MFEKPTLDKYCHVKGCAGNPCFGYGLPSWKIGIVWACAQHQHKLGPADSGLSPAGLNKGGGPGFEKTGRRTPPVCQTPDLFGGG